MQPYLGCFLPLDVEPDEAKRACELFRTPTAKRSESDRVRRLELEVEWNLGPKVFSIYFSLVCGGKVLLHNTHIFLHPGTSTTSSPSPPPCSASS